MTNMESLYKEFKEYFDAGREKIDYFLDVLKNVKEDKWDYEYSTDKSELRLEYQKILIYDNIKIKYVSNGYFYCYSENGDMVDPMILIWADNKCIFETDDETTELAIEIIDFIERVEKRAKGE